MVFRFGGSTRFACGHLRRQSHWRNAKKIAWKIISQQNDASSKGYFSGDKLPSQETIQQLHHQAHEECFIANSVLAEIICEPIF
jgi:organic hydroperoxide reductase OsmC/OhrA